MTEDTPPSPSTPVTELRRDVLTLGSDVDSMVEKCVQALLSHDSAQAEQILQRANTLGMTDRILVQWRDAAEDPDSTEMIGAFHLVTVLDRTVSLVLDLCRLILELDHDTGPERAALGRLALMAGGQVRGALSALASGDAAATARLIEGNLMLDACHAQTYSDLLGLIQSDVTRVAIAQQLYRLARVLEQLGDQAAEIAEQTRLFRLPKVACA